MGSEEEGRELSESASSAVAGRTLGTEDIQNRMIARLAEMRKMDPQDIDINKPYTYYGLSSLEIVLLVTDLEDWLHRPLDATLLWDYPTIQSLANYLANEHLR
jgi:acyl carrier protein